MPRLYVGIFPRSQRTRRHRACVATYGALIASALYPDLPVWANSCRAYGAGAWGRPEIVKDLDDWRRGMPRLYVGILSC